MLTNHTAAARRRGADIEPGDDRWYSQAACEGQQELYDVADLDLKSKNPDTQNGAAVQACKALCDACPVRAACRDDVLATETGHHIDRYSIRASLTPKQRVSLQRSAARPSRATKERDSRNHRESENAA